NIKVTNDKGSTTLLIKSKNPVFFIDIYYPKLTFSDRGFFLLPGEQIKIKVEESKLESFKESDFKIYTLNDYLYLK
ncbi:MAG TPA: glycoside hydrolase family 2 protein, partial [Ignavibacteriaceae bacterium]